MIFFNRFMKLVLNIPKMVLMCERKGILDIFIQHALILFERQSIVCFLFDDLGGNGPLCPHGIDRHQASFQIQEFS